MGTGGGGENAIDHLNGCAGGEEGGVDAVRVAAGVLVDDERAAAVGEDGVDVLGCVDEGEVLARGGLRRDSACHRWRERVERSPDRAKAVGALGVGVAMGARVVGEHDGVVGVFGDEENRRSFPARGFTRRLAHPRRPKRGRKRPRWDSNPRIMDLQSIPLDHLGTRPEWSDIFACRGGAVH